MTGAAEPKLIYHIAEADSWREAQSGGRYEHPSLEAEGFIHCSEREQVGETAERCFSGRQGLIVLFIDETRLQARVVRELAADGRGRFPHIYGTIPVDAVVATLPLARWRS